MSLEKASQTPSLEYSTTFLGCPLQVYRQPELELGEQLVNITNIKQIVPEPFLLLVVLAIFGLLNILTI